MACFLSSIQHMMSLTYYALTQEVKEMRARKAPVTLFVTSVHRKMFTLLLYISATSAYNKFRFEISGYAGGEMWLKTMSVASTK